MKSLVALFIPGITFYLGLALLWDNPRFLWLHHLSSYPWQFWTITVFGVCAAVAGVIDWIYHRRGLRIVGDKEQKYELFALAGGIPLFILMAIASLIRKPEVILIPVILVVMYMTVLICYDEFMFHRRCKPWETAMHRILVFGNALAWLSWAHWCFVEGGAYA